MNTNSIDTVKDIVSTNHRSLGNKIRVFGSALALGIALVGTLVGARLITLVTRPDVSASEPTLHVFIVPDISETSGTFQVFADPQSASLVFASLEVIFDPSSIQLTSNPVLNPRFDRQIHSTSFAESNATGRSTIVLGIGPGTLPPATSTELVTFSFVKAPNSSDSSTATIELKSSDTLFSTDSGLPFVTSVSPTNLNFTPSPTSVVTNTPVPTPSSDVPATSCPTYCQSIGFSDGICRVNSNQCIKSRETHSRGGDVFCTWQKSEDSCCCL